MRCRRTPRASRRAPRLGSASARGSTSAVRSRTRVWRVRRPAAVGPRESAVCRSGRSRRVACDSLYRRCARYRSHQQRTDRGANHAREDQAEEPGDRRVLRPDLRVHDWLRDRCVADDFDIGHTGGTVNRMPRADFYLIDKPRFREDPLLLVCELAKRAFASEQPTLILARSPTQAEALDEKLWEFDDNAFIPHQIAGDDDDAICAVLIAPPDVTTADRALVINLRDECAPGLFERV